MMRFNRGAAESMEQFMERSAGTIKHVKARHSIENWDELYHKSVFSWAGHLARISLYDVARVSYQALLHKDWAWIRSQSDPRGCQHHCRRFKAWRWERPLYKFWGNVDWKTKAVDKEAWNARLNEMVQWRLLN
eukprot:2761186-Karenia_brevis.AAC.1